MLLCAVFSFCGDGTAVFGRWVKEVEGWSGLICYKMVHTTTNSRWTPNVSNEFACDVVRKSTISDLRVSDLIFR